MAVLGPMTSKGLEAVAQRCQELGVPMISLARKDAPEGDFIFQAGLTLKFQIEALAQYAVTEKKQTRFGILYPKNKLGEAAADYFWSAVEKLGGKVQAIAGYAPDETDFKESVNLLSGVSYGEARWREMDTLASERRRRGVGKRDKRTEKFFELRPIVDFEAVFIPDVLKTAGQIVPMFSYRDIESVDFLGTSLWNADEIGTIFQKAAEKRVLFVDIFSAHEGDGSLAQKFAEQFRLETGSEPGPAEAMSFDAAAVLADAISRLDGSSSRERLRRLIRSTSDFSGVTGMINVERGVLSRSLKVYTLKNRQVSLLNSL
jgi:ABC-type branched-subunit amino acid transport system substrate-binding protein